MKRWSFSSVASCAAASCVIFSFAGDNLPEPAEVHLERTAVVTLSQRTQPISPEESEPIHAPQTRIAKDIAGNARSPFTTQAKRRAPDTPRFRGTGYLPAAKPTPCSAAFNRSFA